MELLSTYDSLTHPLPTAAAVTSVPTSPPSVSIPILPRLTSLTDTIDGTAVSSSVPGDGQSNGHIPAAPTAPPPPAPSSAASSATSTSTSASSSSPATLSAHNSHSAWKGHEADKRPAPKGLYDYTADTASSHPAPTAATNGVTTDAATTTAAPASHDIPHSVHSPTRLVSSSSSLVAFHRQLTAPPLYQHEEAIRIRAEIEAQYVHFLRCWQQRANPHIQQTTGAVNPLIDAHSKLQLTFNGQYTAALHGDNKQHTASNGDSNSNGHSSHATQRRHPQSRDRTGHDASSSPQRVGMSHAHTSEARQQRNDAVAAAVDEVRKSARKRRPPKLLAEDDEGHEGTPAQTAAGAKRQRHAGERCAADESTADERQTTAASNSGRAVNGRPAAGIGDDDVVVVEDASSQSEHAINRPRRTATATRKRDVLLAHHFFRHFSLRCYSISNPPQPPPSSSSSPPNCSASVNYRLYMQSQAMLKAQFPKIGKADQPSTSYYACLCVEPVSPFYPYCASLLPPHVQSSPANADMPIVLSSSLFDLCDGLYFRILFFTSPYTTNGFATLLLAHLRLLAVRLHIRLIVCATKAQKQFWISCGFRDAAQHWGGLNFGDTMLLACELMDEGREEEQRRRMAHKSEERLQVKLAHFRSKSIITTAGRPLNTARRQPGQVRRADGGKRTGFSGTSAPNAEAAVQQQQRDKRQTGKDVPVVDSKRGQFASTHALRPTSTSALSTLSALPSSSAAGPTSTFPSPSSSTSSSPSNADDPLQVYHPYIVRSICGGKLLPIRGPPLTYRLSALSSSPFVPSAAVMCVTQQSAYHKGGTMLVTFTLQRGVLTEHEQTPSTVTATDMGALNSSPNDDNRGKGDSGARSDERVWRVKLVQGKRAGGTVVELAEHFMYPLGEDWRERYGLPQEQADDAVKEEERGTTSGLNRTVKDEEAKEEADDDSDSETGNGMARTRSVPELIDLVDDSEQSTNPTPDPLSDPQLQRRNEQKHDDADLMDEDDCNEPSDDRSLPFDSSSKLLSTPTLHATADTETPSSPLALPLPALDPSSSPDTATSPSPSPALPSPLPSSHTARLQLILPMSPTQTQREGGDMDRQLNEPSVDAEIAVSDEDDDTQPGQPDKCRPYQDRDSKPHKYTRNGLLTPGAFPVRVEGEQGVSIFAMMS